MTENNNASMKTVVETFIIEETQELIYDNEKLDQWNAMVEELGLTGQTKIVKKEKSPIPFLHMKTALVRVFETLCPRKVDLNEYDKTPIPVEILRLASLASKEHYFDKIQIWFDEETPDPVCVGMTGEYYCYDTGYRNRATFKTLPELNLYKEANKGTVSANGYDIKEHYLLGRWADVKMPLDQLTEKAKMLYVQKQKSQLEQEMRDAKRKIEDVEHEANVRFGYTTDTTSNLPF